MMSFIGGCEIGSRTCLFTKISRSHERQIHVIVIGFVIIVIFMYIHAI